MLLRIFVATSVRLRRISTALGVMLAILFCTSAQAQLPNVTSGNVTLHLNADGLGPGGFGLADGAPVDTWGTDEGPVNMAIANGDVRPIFVLDAGNGHSGVQFDGTNDVLEILREVAAESIFIYAQLHVDFAATPTQQSMWLGDSDASTKVYGIRRQVAGAGQAVAFVKDEPSPGTNTPFSDTTAFHLHGWSSGSSIFIDGTDNGGASLNFSFSDKTGSGGNDDRIDLIGDERGPLADNPGPDTTFAEILLYDAPLSTPDRIAVENYFFAKYGAPLASSVGIPEPGTLTLILAALPAGMALRRRLRKRLRFSGASMGICLALTLLLAAPAAMADQFMISLIGDQEDLTKEAHLVPGFIALTKWTADNKVANNIVFMPHAGDIVGDETNPPDRNLVQWQRADSAFDVLDTLVPDLPYSASQGNHDIESVATPPGEPTRFHEFFGESRYQSQPGYLGRSPSENSHAHVFKGGDREYLHLNMGWFPAGLDYTWAEKLLDLHPEMPTMVTAHWHMNPAPSLQRSSMGQAIFDRLADPYPQTFFLTGGHLTGIGRMTSQNQFGDDVFEVMQDYENLIVTQNENWMRSIEFDDVAGTIQFKTFTPGMDPDNPVIQYMTDPENEFQYTMDWSTRFLPTLTEYDWTPVGGGSWHTGTNWSQGSEPDSNNITARFAGTAGGPAVIDLTSAVTMANLRFEGTTDYEIQDSNPAANLTLSASDRTARIVAVTGNTTLDIPINVADTAAIDVRGSGSLDLVDEFDLNGHDVSKVGGGTLLINSPELPPSSGTLEVLGGSISGGGHLNAHLEVTSGNVDPGNGTGRLEIHGNATLRAGSTLRPELSGLFGNNDLLLIDGDVTVDGLVDIQLTGGFFPDAGKEFLILSANNVTDLGLELSGPMEPYFTLQVNPDSVVVLSQLDPNTSWTTDGFGFWDDNANWSTLKPTTSGQSAIFGNAISAPSTVVVDTPVTVNSITFDHTVMYVVAGTQSVTLESTTSLTLPTINVSQGSHQFQTVVNLADDTTLDVASSAVLELNNQVNLQGNTLTKTGDGTLEINHVLNSGTFVCAQGTCSGGGALAGNLSVLSATLSPGNSPGRLLVAGDLDLGAEATLLLELAGTIDGSEFDVLNVGGHAAVDGTLRVALLDGFQPEAGDQFNMIDFGSLSGAFAQIVLPDLVVGHAWDTSELYESGNISVVASTVPEPSALVLSVGCACLLATRPRHSFILLCC